VAETALEFLKECEPVISNRPAHPALVSEAELQEG
jgi:hypothetical protein